MNLPPFISNTPDNTHCVGAVYRMMYRYFFHEDLSWEQIDEIARKVPDKGAWTFPLDLWFAKKGIAVHSIEDTNYEMLFDRRESYVIEHYGQTNAEYYLNRSNLFSVIDLIPEYQEYVHQESRKATIEDIRKFLSHGYLIAAEVDSGRLNGLTDMSLHVVLLYDIDENVMTLHDPGLPAYESRRVSIESFMKAFAYEGAGCGIVAFQNKTTSVSQ